MTQYDSLMLQPADLEADAPPDREDLETLNFIRTSLGYYWTNSTPEQKLEFLVELAKTRGLDVARILRGHAVH